MQNTPLDPIYPNFILNKFKSTQPSCPFLPHHTRQFLSFASDTHQLPSFKNSKIKKLNLHQLQIQAEDLDQEDKQDIKHQQNIIQSLHSNQNLSQPYSHIQTQKPAFQRDIKLSSQTKQKNPTFNRFSSSSLFNEGFLPDVKKFYNTFKNLDHQKDKQRLFRYTVHLSGNPKSTVDPLRFAQNIQKNNIFPKKLGIIGRNSCNQLNQNNIHMTKRQMKALAQGIVLTDVKKIGLSNNKFTKSNARIFFQNVPSKLEKINLKGTVKTKDILSCLNSQKLKTGNLKKLNLSDNKITDTGLFCIQHVLTANSNLQILNLSSNFMTDQSCQLIGTFIDKSLNLRNLNLSWNKISGKKVFFLFDAMSNSSSLLNVNLSQNKIGQFLSQPIQKGLMSKKRIQNELKEKNATGSFSSLEALCQFLKNNKYLLHVDLSFNSIKGEDCEVIAQTFNVFNQSLVGLHFYGNSNYITNQLGYLIKLPHTQDDIRHMQIKQLQQSQVNSGIKNSSLQKIQHNDKATLFNRIDFNSIHQRQQNFLLKQKINIIKTKYSNFGKINNTLNRSTYPSECWMCHGWVTQTFTFEITKSKIQQIQSFKTQRNIQLENQQMVNVYIHLENYHYQPLLMKIHKNPKKAFKNMTLGQQKHSKELKGETILKSLHDRDLKKRLESMNTITYCDGLSVKTFKNIDSQEEYIFYNILVKIPPNQKIKYFFTIHGEVFLNGDNPKEQLNQETRNIKFETFNPFRKGLNKKLEQVQRKSKGKQEFKDLSIKIKQFVRKLPSQMEINLQQDSSSTYSFVLNEVNIYSPQKKGQNTQSVTLNDVKLDAIYGKLIRGVQQLTSQEYELLVKQQEKLINEKEEGSQKYISSDKLIEQNQLIYSTGVNQNQFIFLKPRTKNFLFGHSDSKSSSTNLPQLLSLIISHLDQTLKIQSSANFSQLQKIIDKTIKELTNLNKNSQKYTPQSTFYPSKMQFNSKNIYLNIYQSAQTYYQNKIKVNSFTGQITQIGNFDKQSQEKSLKSFHPVEENQFNKYSIKESSKIKLSKVSAYVLIKYSMLREDDGQNSQQSADIYERLEERKKILKDHKIDERKDSKLRIISNDKSSPTTSDYTINIMKAQRKQNAKDTKYNTDKLNQKTKNSNSNAFPKTQSFQLDIKQSLSESNISAISTKLVEEILFPQKKQITQEFNDLEKSTKIQQGKDDPETCFLEKIMNWKAFNNLMDFNFEEKSVLKLVSHQIEANNQQKIKRSKSAKKVPEQKSNKFNLKVNKFCSLQSNSYGQNDPDFMSFLGKKKRPTLNLNSKKISFQQDQNDNLINISNNQKGFDFNLGQDNQNITDMNKSKRLQDKLNGINIGKQIQLFLQFDNLFEKFFIEFSLNESIDTYINRINELINTTNLNTQGKKQYLKVQKQTPAISSIQSTMKSIKKGTSKSIFRKTLKFEDNKSSLINNHQHNVNKNIFMFLTDERQKQHLYFPDTKTPESFPFNDTVQPCIKLNIAKRILNRFQYIYVNLINNLTKKDLKYSFPSGAKQILLKELFIYRCFLFNSPTRDYKELTNKLIDIIMKQNLKQQSFNPQFVTKVKRYSFGKILDLLQEHLLYTIFFLTKHISFVKFANRYKKSSNRNSFQNKPSDSKRISDLVKEENSTKLQVEHGRKSTQITKEQYSRTAPVKINDLNPLKEKERETFISYMKNHRQKFGQELKKQMKSITTQILSIITKLHIKYDIDLQKKQKQKDEEITLRSSRKKSMKSVKGVSEKTDQKQRSESLYPQNSSKNKSQEESRQKKKKKLKLSTKQATPNKILTLKSRPEKKSGLDKKEDQL